MLEIERTREELHHQGKNIELVFQYPDELAKKFADPEANGARQRIGYKPNDN